MSVNSAYTYLLFIGVIAVYDRNILNHALLFQLQQGRCSLHLEDGQMVASVPISDVEKMPTRAGVDLVGTARLYEPDRSLG